MADTVVGAVATPDGGELHAAKAIEDSSDLITIQLTTEHAVEEFAAEVMLACYGHAPDEAESA